MTLRAFRFLSARHALQALQTQEIKISRYDDLNDPFELYGVNLANRKYQRRFIEFKRCISQRYGLLCFSRRWQNPLLWSHYGDRHKGVALEFELDDDIVLEIRYSPRRLRMNIERALAIGWFGEQEAYEVAITKTSHWKYEEEVRVSLELSECAEKGGLLFKSLGERMKIVGLVFGPLCQLSKEEVQKSIPKGDRTDVMWSRLAFTSFNVVLNRAKKTQTIQGLYNTTPDLHSKPEV